MVFYFLLHFRRQLHNFFFFHLWKPISIKWLNTLHCFKWTNAICEMKSDIFLILVVSAIKTFLLIENTLDCTIFVAFLELTKVFYDIMKLLYFIRAENMNYEWDLNLFYEIYELTNADACLTFTVPFLSKWSKKSGHECYHNGLLVCLFVWLVGILFFMFVVCLFCFLLLFFF